MSNATNRFPPGWDEERVRGIVQHYDSLTDDEAAFEDTSHTAMVIPNELVPAVRALLSTRTLTVRVPWGFGTTRNRGISHPHGAPCHEC